MGWDLIADIGGTNARFARVENATICDTYTAPTKPRVDADDTQEDPITLASALQIYMEQHTSAPSRVMIALAGVVKDGVVTLTNADQTLRVDDVKHLSRCENVTFINDFAAAAWALASVGHKDVTILQGATDHIAHGNRLIIGPGTGLGVGTLVAHRGGYIALPGEGGHVGLGGANEEETAILNALIKRWPETQMGDGLIVEAEAVLSGTGLPLVYASACDVLGQACENDDARTVLNAAKHGNDRAADMVVGMFRRHLGRIAGDLALANSAKGGVFIAGGVVAHNPWLLDQNFLTAFNAGGRFSQHRRNIALYHYKNTDFGLIGAANALAGGTDK